MDADGSAVDFVFDRIIEPMFGWTDCFDLTAPTRWPLYARRSFVLTLPFSLVLWCAASAILFIAIALVALTCIPAVALWCLVLRTSSRAFSGSTEWLRRMWSGGSKAER